MSFLSIAFLTALPLAAAPILLHFFDRRRHVVIDWGAMQFLQEAATRRTSSRRLQHWLLLLLRVAALAALVLALARPLAPGNWLGARNRGETILVIDNSLSTMRAHGEASLFESLIEKAEETLVNLDSGDSVRILLASPYPRWLTPASIRVEVANRPELTKQLHELSPTHGSSDLLAALFKAIQSDPDDEALRMRRVVVLTDGQQIDWKTDNVSGWKRIPELLEAARVPTRIDVVEPDDVAPSQNVAVSGVRSTETVVGVDQTVVLSAEVQNHAAGKSKECPVAWSVDGETLESGRLSALEPDETRDLVWKHSFEQTGVFTISCRIDPADDLEPDNVASAVIEVVERIPILLVEGSTGFAELQRDAYFVQAALGRVEGTEIADWRSVFEPITVAPERLGAITLENYRAVVIPNLTDLSPEAVERLADYVTGGGGLWLGLGPRTDVRGFNQQFFNEGGGLSPLSLVEIVDESSARSKTTINPFLEEHPATRVLADHEKLDTGNVKVDRRFRFGPQADGEDVSVLLDLSNGDPLAVENYVGRGRVIVQAIPLNYQWSELALSQAFVVMVHDWLAYLTQPSATRYNLAAGDPITLFVPKTSDTAAVLNTPDGEDVKLTGEPVGDGVTFRTSRTILPGRYALEFGLSGNAVPFQVARNPRESDLTPLTAAQRVLLAEAAGLGPLEAQSVASNVVHREPVWTALLVLLIGVMAAELMLSGFIARRRFGADPIPESAEEWTAAPPLASPTNGGFGRSARERSHKPQQEIEQGEVTVG